MKILKYPKVGLSAVGLIAMTLISPRSAQADYPSTVLSQGPAAYWRLNDTTPVVSLSDAATNSGSLGAAMNGVYQGDLAGRGIPGAVAGDNGASFDGSVEDVRVPFNAALNGNDFTVEGWFAPVGSGDLTCMMSCFEGSTVRRGWLVYQAAANQFQLRTYNNVNATATGFTATTNMTPGTYYHLAISHSNTVFRVYVNGVLLSSGSPTAANAYVPNTTGDFTIGIRSDAGFPWKGKGDEVAYFGTVLSSGQINAHYYAASTNAAGYAAQIQADSPLVYYRLNEPGLPTTVNSGTLNGSADGIYVYPAADGAPGPQPPTYGGLEPSNTGMDLSAGGWMQARALNLNTNAVTIAGWFKPNGNQPASAGLVFHRATTAAGGAYTTSAGLNIDQAGGLQLSYNWDGQTFGAFLSGVNLVDADWNFVSLTVFPDRAVIYIPGQIPATNFASHAALRFEGTTYLGLDPYRGLATTPRKFNGTIDEVSIFGRSLSLGELYSQYAAAIGNLPPSVFADPAAPAGNVYAGDTLTLTVDAGGTPALGYQWRKGGVPVGANSSSYVVAVATTGDSGSYDCVITNAFGSTNSAAASVTILPAITPLITQNSYSGARTIYTNGAIKLGVVAEGGGLSYQWMKGGSPLLGQTRSTLIINNIATGDAGNYQVIVSNSVSTTASATANISVPTTVVGSYEASVVSDRPLSWYRLDDAVSSPLMLDSMGRDDGFWTNASAPVTLGVTGALTGNANKAAHFNLADKSWGEATKPPFTTGDYTIECWARVTNTTVDLVPFSSFRSYYGNFFQQTSDGVWRSYNGYGDLDTTTRRQDAMGPAVSGQWVHLITLYSGATGQKSYINGVWDGNGPFVDNSRNLNTPFRIGAVGPYPGELNIFFDGDVDEAAVYDHALTDAQILAHYQAARFGTTTAPFFTQVPASQTAISNSAATVAFVGAAQGSFPIGYQWYKNGSPIAGATTTTLTLACAYSNAGPYSLTASNSAGTTNAAFTFSLIPKGPSFVNVTNGLVLHLTFDGNFNDTSGKGHNATAVGSPTFVTGRIGSGAAQVTSDLASSTVNYLTLGDQPDFRFSSNVNFSVAYWVQIPLVGGSPALNGDLPFLGTAVNSYGNPGYVFAPSYKLGGWSYSLNGVVQLYGGANSINNANWHHVLHTFDRTGFAVTYLDGVQVDSRIATGAGNLDTGNPLTIGNDPTGAYAEDGIDNLDDIAIWRRSLTQYEAYSIYYAATNSNSSFTTPGNVSLNISQVGTNIQVSWTAGSTLGTLQQADAITGPWTSIPTYVPLYTAPVSAAANKFYRLSIP